MNSRATPSARRRPARATWRALTALALLLVAPATGVRAEGGPDAKDLVRFAIDRGMFRDLNRNDAEVALATYTRSVLDNNGLESRVTILEGLPALLEALRRGEVDLVNLRAEWLLDVPPDLIEGPILFSKSHGEATERYVLLVQDGQPLKRVADLKGRSLAVSSDQRAELAPIWLDVVTQEEGLGPARTAYAKVEYFPKPAQALLPLFFGKFDACVVTQSAWDVMGELNPQVRTRLRAIAVSPPLVPGVALFRKGTSPALKQRILAVISNTQQDLAFKQVLTLFKLTTVEPEPEALLDATRLLLARNRALHGGQRESSATPTPAGRNVDRPAAAGAPRRP